MPAGFVKLRRDIREHVTQGRLSLEEYAVFTFVVMNARHQNGRWRGCALALSKQTQKSERWCQRMLAALRTKGYVTGTPSRGRGQYWMTVEKYFEKASVVSPSGKEGVCGDTLSPKKASVVTPLQEVSTKNKRKEVNPRNGGAAPRSVPEQEQRRRIEAKQKRLEKETEVSRELYVGSGPVCAVPELWNQMKQLARKKAF